MKIVIKNEIDCPPLDSELFGKCTHCGTEIECLGNEDGINYSKSIVGWIFYINCPNKNCPERLRYKNLTCASPVILKPIPVLEKEKNEE